MPFREKLHPGAVGRSVGTPKTTSERYHQIRSSIRRNLLDKFYLAAIDSLSTEKMRAEIAAMVEQQANEEQALVNESERHTLIRDIQDEMLGVGTLELLSRDPTVSGILVNRFNQVYIVRQGKPERANVRLVDGCHLLRIINRIVKMGRRIDGPGECTST